MIRGQQNFRRPGRATYVSNNSYRGSSRPNMGLLFSRQRNKESERDQHQREPRQDPEVCSTDDFPFLIHQHVISHIRQAKVMFIMRGLSGSGKSTIVTRLMQKYNVDNRAIVCSADDFFLLGSADGTTYEFDRSRLSDAHNWCQKRAEEACGGGLHDVIIIDNTNIKRWEMMFYVKLAARCDFTVVVVTPKTSWRFDAEELARRNKHGVSVEDIQRRLKEYQTVYPIYWAWFVRPRDSEQLLQMARKYFTQCVQQIANLEKDFKAMRLILEDDVSFGSLYSRNTASTSSVHCTAYFSGNKLASDAEEYASSDIVQKATGNVFSLAIIGFVITPRTIGARIALNKHQIQLWGNEVQTDSTDDPMNGISAGMVQLSICSSDDGPYEKMKSRHQFFPTDGHGSRAHITLGWSPDSKPVQTGFDLLEVIRKEEAAIRDRTSFAVEGGVARYYGEGRCVVYLKEPHHVNALFSGKY